MARRPRQAHAGQALVEYLLLITVVGIGVLAGIGYLRDSTATAYTRRQQALVAPTFVPSTAVAPTATPVPVAEVRTAAQLDGANTKKKETQYQVRLYNDDTAPISGLTARVFFDLSEISDAGYTAADVVTTELADSCGAAQLGAVTAWDAGNNIYYVNIDWGGYSFPAAGSCEVDLSIHLTNWDEVWPPQKKKTDFSAAGLNYGNFQSTGNIPVYRSGTRVYGNEP